jgi:hypothetical protein
LTDLIIQIRSMQDVAVPRGGASSLPVLMPKNPDSRWSNCLWSSPSSRF